MRFISCQNGQAMTEMTVSLVAIVPIFLLIPMLGKYTDIKHASIQAARYEAWEYTAWYASQAERPAAYNRSQPVKSPRITQREARSRFLSNTSELLSVRDQRGWVNNPARRNPLWKDHTGAPLYIGASETGSRQESLTTPYFKENPITRTLNNVNDVFKQAMEDEVGAGIGIVPGTGLSSFTAIRDGGYHRSTIQLPVQTAAAFSPKVALRSDTDIAAPENLRFSAQAAVLADGWNSGGRQYTFDQSKAASVTYMLNDSVMRAMSGPASDIVPLPEFKSDSLVWGKMSEDLVHPDRLSGPGGHDCGSAKAWSGWRGHGLCRYTP